MEKVKIIIDTNIFSELFKKNKKVLKELYLTISGKKHKIYISPVVYYETMRFLELNNYNDLIDKFQYYIKIMTWIDFTKEDWENAIGLWKKLTIKHIETKSQDADILIAAQAKRIGAGVITNNVSDFKEMDIECESWK